MKCLSEHGHGGRIQHKFLAECVIIHTQHHDALNERHNLPYPACDKAQQDAEEATRHFTKVEILHSEATEKDGKQSGNATTLTLRTGIKRIVAPIIFLQRVIAVITIV